MADQEFLASFAVDIDEAGVTRLQSILSDNRDLANEVAAAFEAATAAIRGYEQATAGEKGNGHSESNRDTGSAVFDGKTQVPNLQDCFLNQYSNPLGVALGTREYMQLAMQQVRDVFDLLSSGSKPKSRQEGTSDAANGMASLNLDSARAEMTAFREEAAQPIAMSANAAGMTSAAKAAYNSIKGIFSTPITIKTKVETESDGGGITEGTPLRMSTGGRFSQPTDVQVAEDGDAEYIIPVKKETRAVPLLKQLLTELSPSARASLSIPEDNTGILSPQSSLTAGTAAIGNVTQNMNQTVSAPVNIQVHSTKANAEQVGRGIYNAAERYLVNTLKGVFA